MSNEFMVISPAAKAAFRKVYEQLAKTDARARLTLIAEKAEVDMFAWSRRKRGA